MADQQEQQHQQELSVREKRELAARGEERTVPGRFFVPPADV